MENTQPTSPHPADPYIDSILPKPPPVKQNWWITSTVIFALLFILMTYQHYTYRANYNVAKTLENAIEETNKPTTSPTPDSTANWKTFSSGEYGFSVSYPKDLEVSSLVIPGPSILNPVPIEFYLSHANSSTIASSAGSFTITVYPGTQEEAMKEERDSQKINQEAYYNKLESISEDIISGKNVRKITYTNPDIGKIVTYTFHNNNLIYFIRASGGYYDVLEKILPTFRFINSYPTPTCIPRPACLDAEPRCMIPETADMCPPTN